MTNILLRALNTSLETETRSLHLNLLENFNATMEFNCLIINALKIIKKDFNLQQIVIFFTNNVCKIKINPIFYILKEIFRECSYCKLIQKTMKII